MNFEDVEGIWNQWKGDDGSKSSVVDDGKVFHVSDFFTLNFSHKHPEAIIVVMEKGENFMTEIFSLRLKLQKLSHKVKAGCDGYLIWYESYLKSCCEVKVSNGMLELLQGWSRLSAEQRSDRNPRQIQYLNCFSSGKSLTKVKNLFQYISTRDLSAKLNEIPLN